MILSPLNEWHFLWLLPRKLIFLTLLILYSSHHYTNTYRLLKVLMRFILVHYHFNHPKLHAVFLPPHLEISCADFLQLERSWNFLRPRLLLFISAVRGVNRFQASLKYVSGVSFLSSGAYVKVLENFGQFQAFNSFIYKTEIITIPLLHRKMCASELQSCEIN